MKLTIVYFNLGTGIHDSTTVRKGTGICQFCNLGSGSTKLFIASVADPYDFGPGPDLTFENTRIRIRPLKKTGSCSCFL
jgi:hypothetical protein